MNVAIEAGVLEGTAQMTAITVMITSHVLRVVRRLFSLIHTRPIARMLSVSNGINAPNNTYLRSSTAGVRV